MAAQTAPRYTTTAVGTKTAQDCVLYDADGNQIVSLGGSGTQYTEGDSDTTITGTAILWEDASDTLRPASADKPLPVAIISGAGSGGTASDDDADFTAGTTEGTPAMGVFESSPSNVTDGDLGIVGITQGRRLKTSATVDAALPAGTNNIGDVDVLSEVASSFDHISNRDVDTAAEQLTASSLAAKFGVEVKADIANTGIVYVGNSDVTAGTTAATDGFPLSPGESVLVKVDNANKVYVIGSAANQVVYGLIV